MDKEASLEQRTCAKKLMENAFRTININNLSWGKLRKNAVSVEKCFKPFIVLNRHFRIW